MQNGFCKTYGNKHGAPPPPQKTRRSRPHALSFFSGHEAEGRYPVYELGCSGLVPLPCRGSRGNPENATAEPCPELAPEVLMPELTSACCNGVGMACMVSFGKRREGEEDAGNVGDDGISFVVCDARGEEIASLRLSATT